MKGTVILVIFLLFIIDKTFAQHEANNWVGFNSSLSSGYLIRYGGSVDGGMNYDGQIGYLIGIGYSRKINNKFDLETGVNYKRNSFNYSYIDGQGENVKSENPEFVDLISIPINIKMKFKRRTFISGGIQYDQGVNKKLSAVVDDQTGIGINFKMGKDFKLSNKTILTLAPEVVIHGVFPFHPENNQQSLTEIGLRISYSLGF